MVSAIVIFAVSFLVGYHLCVKETEHIDELEWLKKEYNLSQSQLEEIRKLHAGYRPICEQMCAKIADKKRQLSEALEKTTNMTPEIEKMLVDIGTYRAQCQAEMLKHFYLVGSKMPPEQGQRYFKKMRAFVLGGHEQMEESMSKTQNAGAHSHP
ncbi:MAG: hypothetical protein ACPMAG_04675 [Limisphaerales bacterium]